MIHCNAWPGVKISGNAEVRGNVGSIIRVEVGANWFFWGKCDCKRGRNVQRCRWRVLIHHNLKVAFPKSIS